MSRWILLLLLVAARPAPAQSTATPNASAPPANAAGEMQGACTRSSDDTTPNTQTPELAQALQQRRDLVQRLSSSSDAHQLLAAAIFSRSPQSADDEAIADSAIYSTLLSRAQQAAPRDPQVWWIGAMQYSDASLDRQSDQSLQHLLQLVPDNAAAWLLELDRAQRAGDPIASRLALQHAANARYFEDYMIPIAATLVQAMTSATPDPMLIRLPDDIGLNEATSTTEPDELSLALSLAMASPGYTVLMRACDPMRAADDPQLRADCLAIGKLMSEHSSTLISTRIGARLYEKLTDDPETLAGLERQRRTLDWLMFNTTELIELDHGHRYFQLMLQGGSEIENMRTLLREAGLSLAPPDDWKSPSEMAKAAATTASD